MYQNLDHHADAKKRLTWARESESIYSAVVFFPGIKHNKSNENIPKNDTPPINIQDPIRVAIFNSGSYDARVKVNYIIDNKQAEEQLDSNILTDQERSLFVPNAATNIRIRVIQIGILTERNIIDKQIHDLKNVDEICYILAGTRAHPVYGICSDTYSNMLKAWTKNF